MTSKHPHYDTIVAWAEGKIIQYWCIRDLVWLDWDLDDVAPLFHPDREYRVKPEIIRYRTFLLKSTFDGSSRPYVWNVREEDDKDDPREEWPQFVRWLGDWQEVEI